MNRDVIPVFVLAILVLATGTYILARSGQHGPVDARPEAASEISDIRVIGKGDNTADLEIDYVYSGEAGPLLPLVVAYEMLTGSQHLTHVRTAGMASKGAHTQRFRLDRPMMNPYGSESVRVSATLGEPRKGTVVARRVLDAPVTWESLPLPAEVRDSREFILQQATMALNMKDFAALENMFEGWNDPAVRTRDGRWRLSALRGLVDQTNFDYPDKRIASLREWRQHAPESEGAAIATALFWIRYAWHARGGGYTDTVSETGWQLFRERLQKAEQALLESSDYAADNPLWFYCYLKVALGLDWEKPRILELYKQAIERQPLFYWNLFAAISAVSPKWGGNVELMDLVAKSAAEQAGGSEGEILYARAYWSISGAINADQDFFRDTLVSWPRMRQGFRELLEDFPDSDWNLNNFAAFACRAGDRETFQELHAQINTRRLKKGAWRRDYTLESCERRFMQSS